MVQIGPTEIFVCLFVFSRLLASETNLKFELVLVVYKMDCKNFS